MRVCGDQRASQAECRRFEPGIPLPEKPLDSKGFFFFWGRPKFSVGRFGDVPGDVLVNERRQDVGRDSAQGPANRQVVH